MDAARITGSAHAVQDMGCVQPMASAPDAGQARDEGPAQAVGPAQAMRRNPWHEHEPVRR